MENIADETKWHKAFSSFLQEFDLPEQSSSYQIPLYNDINKNNYVDYDNDRRNRIMMRMQPLFAFQPKFKTVCEKSKNHLIDSYFKSYTFYVNDDDLSVNKIHDEVEDLKYTISICGGTLTSLYLKGYPFSDIMPLIKTNCPNIEELYLKFKDIKDEHFDNVFFNMSHLRELMIKWECDNSTIPITLIESLKQVGETLKFLQFLGDSSKKNYSCLPDELASVFPKLTALEVLSIHDFDQNQLLFQSIGEITSLVSFTFSSNALMEDPKFNKTYDMYPIGNLKNIKYLYIHMDYGVTDEFLINLSNNAKKLEDLVIVGTNITDNGILAINNFKELEMFSLRLNQYKKRNEFITDKSISRLYNKKLDTLDISNCIKITNKSMIELVQNLRELKFLHIENTNINENVVLEVTKIREHWYRSLNVYVTFIDPRDESSKTFRNINFRTVTKNLIK